MEKRNKILIILFALIIVISLSGFYKSYLSYFPDFSKFQTIIHLHFLAFLGWFALIILQPILIMQKKINLHHKLGKFSYFLAPILVITILLLTREKILREIIVSKEDASLTAFIGLMDAISFSVFYLIAMINKRNLRWHVAFIIGATLIVLNPGMARLLNQFQYGLGLVAAVFTPFLVSITILIFEKIKFKREIVKSPYLLFLLMWIFEIVLFITIPQTTFWQISFAYITKIL